MDKKYYIYVILTEKDTLYCGFTDNVEKRFEKHKKGTACKYTRAFKPVKLVYTQEFDTKSEALKAEYSFKQLPKAKKLEIINQNQLVCP